MKIDEQEKNRALEEILSHLDKAIGLCEDFDFSEIPVLEQTEWQKRIKICKDAIRYVRGSVQRLQKIL